MIINQKESIHSQLLSTVAHRISAMIDEDTGNIARYLALVSRSLSAHELEQVWLLVNAEQITMTGNNIN